MTVTTSIEATNLGLLEQMFEGMPVAMAVLDSADRLVRINPFFRETFLYDRFEPRSLDLESFRTETYFSRGDVCGVLDRLGRIRYARLSIIPIAEDSDLRVLTVVPVDWGAMVPTGVDELRREIDATKVGVWTRDVRGNKVLWSPELEEMVGLQPGEFGGTRQHFRDLVHTDDQSLVGSAIAEAEASGNEFNVDFRYMHRDGTVRWMKGVGRGHYDEDGNLIWVTGAGIDITAQRKSSQALIDGAQRFLQMANSLPAIVWTAESDNTITFLNDRWHEYSGLPKSETDAITLLSIIHPDDHASLTESWEKAQQSLTRLETEARYRRFDGEYRWFLLRCEPVLGPDGMLKYWCGTAIDIEDSRRADKLNRFHLRLSDLLRSASSPDAILATVIEELGNFLGASRCFYTDVDVDAGTVAVHEEYSTTRGSFVGEHSLTHVKPSWLAQLQAREPVVIPDMTQEFDPQMRGGIERSGIGALMAVPMYEGDQLRNALVLTQSKARNWTAEEVELVQEVCRRTWMALQTKRAQSEIQALNEVLELRVEERTEELKTAYRDMEGFTYSVSHDLRAPLRAIMSSSMILLEDYGATLDPEAKQQLTRQAAAARQLGTLIDDLLSFSRLGRAEVARKPVDLARIVGELDLALRSRHEKAADLVVESEMLVKADPTLIRMVMENLLDNAYKYSQKDGILRIEVGCRDTDEGLTYFVKDNGIGFDDRYADKLFQPFERLHRPDEYPGTGIGLANVKRIIERHGGRVWAESARDEGAAFFFTL